MKTTRTYLISGGRLYIVVTKRYEDGHTVTEYTETRSSAIFNRVKQYLRLKLSKRARIEKLKGEVREYLKSEWQENCPTQYQKYFDEWFENITDHQLYCASIWMTGQMGPFYDNTL